MKSLKLILHEGLLSDMEDTLVSGDKLVQKEIFSKLRKKIESMQVGWLIKADNKTYEDIIQYYEEIPSDQKKGTKWTVMVPDKNSSFEPISIAPHKAIFRKFNENTCKEVLGTSASAWDKRLKNIDKLYKKNNLSNGWLADPNYSNYQMLMYLIFSSISGYKQIKSVPSGDDWYTVGLLNDWKNQSYDFFSFNPNKKEWAYGINSNVPNNFIKDPGAARSVSFHLLKAVKNYNYVQSYDTEYIKRVLTNTSIEDYNKNRSNFIKLKTGRFDWNGSGNYRDDNNYKINTIYYINGQDFTYVTSSQIIADELSKTTSNTIK